ncbi:elongator complex protein 1-like isoform X2 [Zingiber officinale]|uniref:elongator complex protein 1-like isoform X2 n=1 Tax=Zingiber officinale TaxID=94328 RepID=UPI001C4B2971|nr:elongator complex protein 1-like isoform X2 [Zingiber officinale]
MYSMKLHLILIFLIQFDSSISWRGDGRYFATISQLYYSSSLQKNSFPLQKLNIWDRESGDLHSSSELKKFMGTSLDWMPSGAKVATVYDRKGENKCPLIVLFEKNGMERSSFSINETAEATIQILKWNCNSDLLATSIVSDEFDSIKIWSFSNNHWYLKQDMRYPKKEGVRFLWDPLKPMHLISWTLSGKVTFYNFIWTTAVTETSVALVIDNSNVLVTPLSISLVPPPMSLFSLKFSSAVREISFLSKSSKKYIAACLSNGSLCVAETPSVDMWDAFEGKVIDIEACHSDLRLESFMHLTWLDSNILFGITSRGSLSCLGNNITQQNSRNYFLHEIELACSENSEPESFASSGWHAQISEVASFEKPIIAIAPVPTKKCAAFVQLQGGPIIEYSSTKLMTLERTHHHDSGSDHGFSSSCPWMKAVLVRHDGILRDLVFGLDDNGRLHLGGRILCKNCSSFSFYSANGGVTEQVVTHLLLITKQDLLIIIGMDDILRETLETKIDSYSTSNNHKEENKDFVHIWERGAKLIGVMHGDEAAVILQTNRGSLECIYPRKLVLVSITNALVQERFKDAMLMVRRHRIDFNVIVDYHGWKAFLKSAKEFVRQVDNLGHITEFVSSIKNENVINTLYKAYFPQPSPIEALTRNSKNIQDLATGNKVSDVLFAVRRALEEQMPESSGRELCILTTLAHSEPPALEEALNRIKVIRESELLGADNKQRLYPSGEESVKHLVWLTDPEAVYEAALGLYDLNLAAMVAVNSQKDPKEFLPYLKGLEDLPPPVMRYTIDLRLHRYESALKHIVSAGDDYYEDCMNLLKNNPELFPIGLQLISDHVKRSQILEAWGDHLNAEKQLQDAAMIYLCCSSLHKALKAYRACADWKGVFTVAGLLKLGDKEVLLLANDLCEEIQALGKPAESAKIALEYLKDISRAVDYLIMAREWEEALRISHMQEDQDLDSPLRDACIECATALTSEYNEGLEKVGKYCARYLAVRQRRIMLAAKIQAEDRLASDVDYDTLSETSSTFSNMSAYTGRTEKNSSASISSSKASRVREMRRQKHRGGKIRPGSPGEELALVEHLKGMSLTETAQHELKGLIITLIMLGKEEIASKLQSAADAYQISQQAAVKLAEDTMENDTINEENHTLENYTKIVRVPYMKALPPESKALLPPMPVLIL